MRMSHFFIPTLKEAPKDAVLKSHIYMIRGGFIHQIGSGIYNFLPLGTIVLNKIKSIIGAHIAGLVANVVLNFSISPSASSLVLALGMSFRKAFSVRGFGFGL